MLHSDFTGEETTRVVDRCFLEGTSPIDLANLLLTSREQAWRFLQSYGYDLENEAEHREVLEIHREALCFLKEQLLPAPREGQISLQLPLEMEAPQDPIELLLLASRDPFSDELQPWACAILRIMHVINLANHSVPLHFHRQAKQQVLGRYRKHVHRDEHGKLFLGNGSGRVSLVSALFREEKSRDSLLLKLLHKPENLPHTVYDRIGVRLVTPTKDDAMRALSFMHENHLANVAHITPGRSRNTLVQALCASPCGDRNPHSHPDLGVIQFTCQEMVRCALSRRGRQRFFFPYEVQILDLENHHKSEHGDCSHSSYRQRQLQATRLRVLGRLLLQKQSEGRLATVPISNP